MTRSPAAQRVLDKAMQLFEQQGYSSTSVAAIETAAGLSAGAGGLYRHFPTKQAILEAGVRDILQMHDTVRAVDFDTSNLSLRDELGLFVRGGLILIASQRALIRLFYRDLEAIPELHAEVKSRLVYTGTLEFATRLQQLAKRRGLPDDLDFEAVATIFAGAVTNVGVIQALLDEPPPVSHERFAEAWIDALVCLLEGGRPNA